MTIYALVYLTSYAASLVMMSRYGDVIDRAHAWSLLLPIALWFGAVAQTLTDPLAIIGLVWILHAATMVWFSDRLLGGILGAISVAIAMMAAIALMGWLPSAKGQGVAHNFYHYATVISYLHIGAILGAGLGNIYRRHIT